MSLHTYDNPGVNGCRTVTHTGGIPHEITTDVTLRDGTDTLNLSFTDLDALTELRRTLEEACAAHTAALLEARSETVRAEALEPDDLVMLDGELVCVDQIVLEGTTGEDVVHVHYGKKVDGTYDMTAGRSMSMRRATQVKRLIPGRALSAVK